jgi:hypothetical protein
MLGGSAAEARSTRWKKRAGTTPLHPNTNLDRISTWAFPNQYIQQAPPHCQERNSHRDHAGTMRDSFALVRLIIAPIVRPLVFATSAFIGVSATYVLYILIRRRISAYRSQLRNVPGPGGANWFKGNFTQVPETDSTRLQEEWVRKYGHVLKYQSLLWVRFRFFYYLEASFSCAQYDRLALCRHRNYWPWTLSRSPTFYKIATLFRNPKSYFSVSVFLLVKVCMTVHFGVLF